MTLIAHLCGHLRFCGHGAQSAGFSDVMANRLLAIDIFAELIAIIAGKAC